MTVITPLFLAILLALQPGTSSLLDRVKGLDDVAAARVVASDTAGTRAALDELLTLVDASVHSDRQRPEQRRVQFDKAALAAGARVSGLFARATGDRTYARRFEARRQRLAGTVLLNERRYRQALVPLNAALREAKALDDAWLQTITHVNLAYGYLELGKGSQAVAECEAAAAASQSLDAKAQGLALFNLGSVYLHIGDAARSLDYSRQAVSLSQKAHIKLWEGNSLLNIGAAHLQLGELEPGRQAFEQALVVLETTRDRLGLGRALYNLGLVAVRQQGYAEAAAYLERALPIIRDVDIRHSHEIEPKSQYQNPVELAALQVLTDSYLKLGDTEKAAAHAAALRKLQERKAPGGHSHREPRRPHP
ncbi:MAG: tetratricopeptide repeat protein [Acidobacteria bacterium]|nr:tetratricopeptide repeat protein [Acidobacteriota bacterium]